MALDLGAYIASKIEAFRNGRADNYMIVANPMLWYVLRSIKVEESADFGVGEGHIFDKIAALIRVHNKDAEFYAVDNKAILSDKILAAGVLIPCPENIFSTRVPDGKIDLLVLNYMLQAMKTAQGQEDLLKQAKKKMSKRGFLLISDVYKRGYLHDIVDRIKHHLMNGLVPYNIKTVDGYLELLEQNGFEIVMSEVLGDRSVVILACLMNKT